MADFSIRLYHVLVTVRHQYFDSPEAAENAVEHAIKCVGNNYGMKVTIINSIPIPVDATNILEPEDE